MAKIIKLDKHVADLIAAGEVVERPASVVKELVENSMDAGATAVTVEIRRGGLELIRVTDNGSGIGREDIRTAFLRHATSKIRTADDLSSVMTMGFRGEALASIAAVSKVTVFTRAADETAGLCYEIAGGEESGLEEAGCPAGTTMLVRELFYNTPARMKFIKKDATEAGHIQTAVRRAALARPDISFKLIKDGEEVLHTPGDHSLISAIYCVYGGPFAAGLEKADTVHEGVRVTGYVSKPVYSQGNRAKQEFFVNSRPVRSKILTAALEEAYKNRIMAGRYPACVLHIEINPSVLDVNVHPAKTEIKFAFERQIFDAIYLAVKDAMDREDGRAVIAAAPRPPKPEKIDNADFVQTSLRAESPENKDYGAVIPEPERQDTYRTIPAEDARTSYSPSVSEEPEAFEGYRPVQREDNAVRDEQPKWKILGEAFDSYIIVEDGDDILFIDKHAAHERIIFEKLSARAGNPLSQYLLEPLVLRFGHDELDALLGNRELLFGMGFEFEDFGGDSVLLRALPEGVDRSDAGASLEEIAQSLIENRRLPMTAKREEALRLVACKAALKAGSFSSYEEKYALVDRVMSFGDIRYCPHGRPVAALLKRSELEKRFGRT